LENLNTTLQQISDLLKTVEIAILIVAVALSILLIGEFFLKISESWCLRVSDFTHFHYGTHRID
uniref:Glycoprotein n=1 Tax=Haemonchus placei TaxID=6290 RepID=A0A0N4WG53_HAEPC